MNKVARSYPTTKAIQDSLIHHKGAIETVLPASPDQPLDHKIPYCCGQQTDHNAKTNHQIDQFGI